MSDKSYQNGGIPADIPQVTQLESDEQDSLLMRGKTSQFGRKGTRCILISLVVLLLMLTFAFSVSNKKRLFTATEPPPPPPDANDLAEQAIEKLDNLTHFVQHGLQRQPQAIPDGCESSIIIIRHCDDLGGLTKDDDGSVHCSPIGEERSQYVASLFGDDDDDDNHNDDQKTTAVTVPSRWPMPKLLYAMNTNERQVVTLTPLAQKANIEIEEFSSALEVQRIHFDRLTSSSSSGSASALQSQLCHGEVTVVAWRHHFIADLAVALGCGPDNGCPQDWDDLEFDSVWEIRYLYVKDDGWHVYGSVTREYFDPIEYEHEHEHEHEHHGD